MRSKRVDMTIKAAVRPKPDTMLINIKVTPEELATLRLKADQYTKGNLSLLLRYAALHFVPSKQELQAG